MGVNTIDQSQFSRLRHENTMQIHDPVLMHVVFYFHDFITVDIDHVLIAG